MLVSLVMFAVTQNVFADYSNTFFFFNKHIYMHQMYIKTKIKHLFFSPTQSPTLQTKYAAKQRESDHEIKGTLSDVLNANSSGFNLAIR